MYAPFLFPTVESERDFIVVGVRFVGFGGEGGLEEVFGWFGGDDGDGHGEGLEGVVVDGDEAGAGEGEEVIEGGEDGLDGR